MPICSVLVLHTHHIVYRQDLLLSSVCVCACETTGPFEMGSQRAFPLLFFVCCCPPSRECFLWIFLVTHTHAGQFKVIFNASSRTCDSHNIRLNWLPFFGLSLSASLCVCVVFSFLNRMPLVSISYLTSLLDTYTKSTRGGRMVQGQQPKQQTKKETVEYISSAPAIPVHHYCFPKIDSESG